MTWQAYLTIDGAVDQAWFGLSEDRLFNVYNNLVLESHCEGWTGEFVWWPDGEHQGEWADQSGGCYIITPRSMVA